MEKQKAYRKSERRNPVRGGPWLRVFDIDEWPERERDALKAVQCSDVSQLRLPRPRSHADHNFVKAVAA